MYKTSVNFKGGALETFTTKTQPEVITGYLKVTFGSGSSSFDTYYPLKDIVFILVENLKE